MSSFSPDKDGSEGGGASYADGWVRRAQWGGEEESQVSATPWMPFSSVEVDDLCKSNVICLTRQGWHEGKVKCRSRGRRVDGEGGNEQGALAGTGARGAFLTSSNNLLIKVR